MTTQMALKTLFFVTLFTAVSVVADERPLEKPGFIPLVESRPDITQGGGSKSLDLSGEDSDAGFVPLVDSRPDITQGGASKDLDALKTEDDAIPEVQPPTINMPEGVAGEPDDNRTGAGH